MNNINFIKKIIPHQQLQFYKWVKISIVFLVSCLVCAIAINCLQLYKISKLKIMKIKIEKELTDFEEIMKNKNSLKLDLESLKNQIDSIENAKIENKNIIEYFEQIANAMPDEIYLKDLNYDVNGFLELKGVSFDSHLVSIFVKTISKLPFFKNVKLIYLKSLGDQNVENIEQPNLEFFIRIKLINSRP